MDAKKQRYSAGDLAEVFEGATKLSVAKGKKVVEFDLRETSIDDPLLVKAVIGPSGNLRAPTILRGKSALVGFSAELYERELG